jgi:hypothetical protein
MKKIFLVISIFLFVSCDKPRVNENEYVNITYELQTNVTGFTQIKYGKFYSLSTGISGIEMQDWPISGTGTFTQTESIRKGFIAEIYAIHPGSNDWFLKIKSANGTVLKTSTVSFITDSNYYFSTVSVAVQ